MCVGVGVGVGTLSPDKPPMDPVSSSCSIESLKQPKYSVDTLSKEYIRPNALRKVSTQFLLLVF